MKSIQVETKRGWEAPEEHAFVLANGTKLLTLYDLITELDTMTQETFQHHVNDAKNDFAQWTQDVFGDKKLADTLRTCATKEQHATTIINHLVTT